MPRYVYDEPEERDYIVLTPGEYDFAIVELGAWEHTQQGADMLPLKLAIKHPGAQKVFVFDRLVFQQSAKFKIDQLLKSIGCAPAPGATVDFDNPRWLVGKRGRCYLKIEVNPKTEERHNKVSNYVFRAGKVEGRAVTTAAPSYQQPPPPQPAYQPPPPVQGQPPEDDDIPF